jgi:hypothetical protein
MSLGRHLSAAGLGVGDRLGVDFAALDAIALAGAAQ